MKIKRFNNQQYSQGPPGARVSKVTVLDEIQEDRTTAKWNMIDYDKLPKNDYACPLLQNFGQYPQICVHSLQIDEHISKAIGTGTIWEKRTLKMVEWELSKDPSLGFIDIGAHVGLYALVAAWRGHKVVAVEALKANAELLAISAKLNGKQENVTIYNNLMFVRHENLHIATFPGDLSRTCIYHDQLDSKFIMQPETVPSVTLDDLSEIVPFKRAVLKIDIEGLEVYVFSHAKNLLADVDIPFILMEWWYGDRGYALQSKLRKTELVTRLLDLFLTHGYRAIDTKHNTLSVHEWDFWPMQVIWIKIW